MPSDALVQQAREHHRLAAESLRAAGQHRAQRDDLIRRARAADPETWSYSRLAKAVGCSPELVAAIVQGRRNK